MHASAWKIANKIIWEVKVGNVDRSNGFYCAIIHGSSKVHQVWYVTCQDPTMFEYKDLSCFCVQCQDFLVDFACNTITSKLPLNLFFYFQGVSIEMLATGPWCVEKYNCTWMCQYWVFVISWV